MGTGFYFLQSQRMTLKSLLVGTQAVLCIAVAKCKSLFCGLCITCYLNK